MYPNPPPCLLPVLAGCCHARRHVSRVRTSRPRDQRDRGTAGHWPASSPPPRPAQRPSMASNTGHTQPAARALQTVKLFSIYNCTLLLCKWALNVSSLYPILIMKCFRNIYTLWSANVNCVKHQVYYWTADNTLVSKHQYSGHDQMFPRWNSWSW